MMASNAMRSRYLRRPMRTATVSSLALNPVYSISVNLPVCESPLTKNLATRRHKRLPKPSLRQRLNVYLEAQTKLGSIWTLIDTVLAISLCCTFIAATTYYKSTTPQTPPFTLQFLDAVLSVIFLLQYLPKYVVAEYQPPWYNSLLVSFILHLTIISVLPGCLFWIPGITRSFQSKAIIYTSPIRFCRAYISILRAIIPGEKSILKIGPILYRILRLLFTLLFILLLGTTVIWIVELRYEDVATLDFFDAFFFTALTCSTIAYLSDIVPDAMLPRVIILAVMFSGLTLIPFAISELVMLIRGISKFEAPYKLRPNQPHIIVIPGGGTESVGLRQFLQEFFSVDHGPFALNTKVVILFPTEPDERLRRTLRDPMFRERVQYVKGSALTFTDLSKIKANHAEALFILAKKFTSGLDDYEKDAENLLRMMAILRFDPRLRVYAQCLIPEYEPHFKPMTRQLICVDALKLSLLAYSCITPGFSTLISILTTSYSAPEVLESLTKTQPGCTNIEWMSEFIDGLSREIYAISVSEAVKGMSFFEVSELFFQNYGVVLFGIGVRASIYGEDGYSQSAGSPSTRCQDTDIGFETVDLTIYLAPDDYVMVGDEVGLLIAKDVDTAQRIGSFGKKSDARDLGSFACSYHGTPGGHGHGHEEENETTPLIDTGYDGVASSDLARSYLSGNNGIGNNSHEKRSFTAEPFNFEHSWNEVAATPSPTPTRLPIRRTHTVESPFSTTGMNNGYELDCDGDDSGSCTLRQTTPSYEHPTNITELPSHVKDHIVVCDSATTRFPKNLELFVKPLRATYLKKTSPIVILSPTVPSNEEWDQISQYEEVYFVQGCPSKSCDLTRSKIHQAKRVIILADPSVPTRGGEKIEDSMTILILLHIRVLARRDVYVIVEFVHPENMRVLVDTEDAACRLTNDYWTTPAFMSGHCFSVSMIDSIICQSYYNPHLITILNHLVSPLEAYAHVYLIPVPSHLIGYDYAAMYRYATTKQMIPLGLYRKRQEKISNFGEDDENLWMDDISVCYNGNGGGEMEDKSYSRYFEYVYAAPKPDTVLRDDDWVYVLSNKQPQKKYMENGV